MVLRVLTFSQASKLEAPDRGHVGRNGSFANHREKHFLDLRFVNVAFRSHVQFHKHILANLPSNTRQVPCELSNFETCCRLGVNHAVVDYFHLTACHQVLYCFLSIAFFFFFNK